MSHKRTRSVGDIFRLISISEELRRAGSKRVSCCAQQSADKRKIGLPCANGGRAVLQLCGMSNYRRAWVQGGIDFFTVNLLERRRRLLVKRVDLLRDVVPEKKWCQDNS